MSARSTPAPKPLSRSNSQSLISPASSSRGLPTSEGFPYNRRRQPSTNNFTLSSVPENFRRPSGLSSRKASQTSASGTSTPYGLPRRRKVRDDTPKGAVGSDDWAELEPDEVFRRLPVGEVKKVEAKMRSDALNKQSELRSMVGTRYRDLLTSATQITALRNSSIKVSKSLRDVRESCSSGSADVHVSMDTEDAPSEGEDVISLLPIASHMKLLLDAPEALYSSLARHEFLKAAFLWLLTRVVRESLSAMAEDVKGPYLPLLQKQWETLQPFRGQIVQRATASLRSREKVNPKTLSETLVAIILLDNLPVSEALALFLQQRTKTLRDILVHPESSSSKQNLAPTVGRRRGDSRASARSVQREREEIGNILGESVNSLLETVTLVQSVFARNPKTNPKESLLEGLQRLVQIGEPQATTSLPPLTRRSSHERRASRLASISLSLPKLSTSAAGPPVSASRLLSELPSSQILLRHLPTSITGFTPFITPSSTPDLCERLRSWQSASIGILAQAVPHWLEALHSVADVWHVRGDLTGSLAEGDLEEQIKPALEREWGRRIEEVWGAQLDELLRIAEVKVREAAEEIRQKGEESDIDPELFTFSDLPFPPVPSSALTASAAPFNAFLSAVGKRTSLRTPALDHVLTNMETYAADIKADKAGLPSALHSTYGQKVEDTLEALIKVLEKVRESVGPSRGDGKDGIAAEMFVGRVAIYLAKQSNFLKHLTVETDVDLAGTIESLLKVHASSTARWQNKAVENALVLLQPIFDPMRGAREVKASWQGPYPISPSSAVMVALHSLSSATRNLGLPPATDLPIAKDLVLSFSERARALPGWNDRREEAIAQAVFDLSFLGLVSGEDFGKDVGVQKMLNRIPSSIPPEFTETLPQLVIEHLRRSQVLLHPLIQHLDHAKVSPGVGGNETKGGLLKFGAPKGGGFGSEFRSPLPVAKPGKRFGLLSIAA